MDWNEATYKKIKETVSQHYDQIGTGMYLEEIAKELHLAEEEILQVLTTRSYKGELVGTEILITFTE